MIQNVKDRLFQWNFNFLHVKLKFYGFIYITNNTTGSKVHYRLWQLWSMSLIIVVGAYSCKVYYKILKDTLVNDDYDQVIEDSLLSVEICSFLLAIAGFYAKVHLKRKEILELFNKCVVLYQVFSFPRKASDRIQYFFLIKTLSDTLCVTSLMIMITTYLIYFVGCYICKILLIGFLFSIYCYICTLFYAITLFFVHVNDCLSWELLYLMEYDINRKTLEVELVKVVQVHEKFLDLHRKVLNFFKPFVLLSILHLAFGIISEMAQIYLCVFVESEYEAQILRGSVFLALYVPQLYGHCHGMQLLMKSVSLSLYSQNCLIST